MRCLCQVAYLNGRLIASRSESSRGSVDAHLVLADVPLHCSRPPSTKLLGRVFVRLHSLWPVTVHEIFSEAQLPLLLPATVTTISANSWARFTH
jgi:hypothetical protein